MLAPVRQRTASYPALLAALLVTGLLLLLPDGARAQANPPWEAEVWSATLEDARAKSIEDGRPVLLLFPPIRPGVYRPLQDTAGVLQSMDRLHPARARGEEAASLLERYGLRDLPALVLLDRHGGVVERWQGLLPLDLWPQVERDVKRLRKEEEELAGAVREARAALRREDYAALVTSLRQAARSPRAGYPEREEAARLELELLGRASAALRRTLGQEGLVSDARLAEKLTLVRERFPHRAVEERIARELKRLQERRVGGGALRPGG